jgi:hypothetical protein
MNSASTETRLHPGDLPGAPPTLFERLVALANTRIAVSDPLRVIERWIDNQENWLDRRPVAGSLRWAKRRHPHYQLYFTQRARGQVLPVYVDYCARTDFLGLFIYWPQPLKKHPLDRLHDVINSINWNSSYGTFEFDPIGRTLRYRISIDAQGIRLTPGFLHFMLQSGLEAMDKHATEFLPGPVGLVA